MIYDIGLWLKKKTPYKSAGFGDVLREKFSFSLNMFESLFGRNLRATGAGSIGRTLLGLTWRYGAPEPQAEAQRRKKEKNVFIVGQK